ncbi:hypothetical protein [Bacillus paralicheniformis]|uniref:hypothetical protein n=1 Tax=Bacillus paralicheniformis TaxID=1648923 RepID=UPI001FD6476A|nr:hypothetical protein [Bacillus paralicheniformis]MCJ8223738.1 hypothetical protein [Bacillus paralicheniformis]
MAKNKIRKTAIRKVTDLQRKMEEMRAVEEQIKKDLFESIGRFIYNTWDVGDNAEKLEDVIESLTDIANERLNSDFELESESSQESESNDTNDSSDYLNTSQTENTPI